MTDEGDFDGAAHELQHHLNFDTDVSSAARAESLPIPVNQYESAVVSTSRPASEQPARRMRTHRLNWLMGGRSDRESQSDFGRQPQQSVHGTLVESEKVHHEAQSAIKQGNEDAPLASSPKHETGSIAQVRCPDTFTSLRMAAPSISSPALEVCKSAADAGHDGVETSSDDRSLHLDDVDLVLSVNPIPTGNPGTATGSLQFSSLTSNAALRTISQDDRQTRTESPTSKPCRKSWRVFTRVLISLIKLACLPASCFIIHAILFRHLFFQQSVLRCTLLSNDSAACMSPGIDASWTCRDVVQQRYDFLDGLASALVSVQAVIDLQPRLSEIQDVDELDRVSQWFGEMVRSAIEQRKVLDLLTASVPLERSTPLQDFFLALILDVGGIDMVLRKETSIESWSWVWTKTPLGVGRAAVRNLLNDHPVSRALRQAHQRTLSLPDVYTASDGHAILSPLFENNKPPSLNPTHSNLVQAIRQQTTDSPIPPPPKMAMTQLEFSLHDAKFNPSPFLTLLDTLSIHLGLLYLRSVELEILASASSSSSWSISTKEAALKADLRQKASESLKTLENPSRMVQALRSGLNREIVLERTPIQVVIERWLRNQVGCMMVCQKGCNLDFEQESEAL